MLVIKHWYKHSPQTAYYAPANAIPAFENGVNRDSLIQVMLDLNPNENIEILDTKSDRIINMWRDK